MSTRSTIAYTDNFHLHEELRPDDEPVFNDGRAIYLEIYGAELIECGKNHAVFEVDLGRLKEFVIAAQKAIDAGWIK